MGKQDDPWADETTGLAAASNSVCGVWTSNIVIETEWRRNCLVHLWARYWVWVASGLNPNKWMY